MEEENEFNGENEYDDTEEQTYEEDNSEVLQTEDENGEDTPENTETPAEANTVPRKTVKIFVGNLGEGANQKEIQQLFAEFGEVVECVVCGRYGFVHMADKAEAEKAITALNRSMYKGIRINIELSSGENRRNGPESEPVAVRKTVKIFVGNLGEDSKTEDIRLMFADYGEVVECDVCGRYGFVHMAEKEQAQIAITALNGSMYKDNRINVEMSSGVNRRGEPDWRNISKKLYVGNLPEKCVRTDLLTAFEKVGKVTECEMVKNYAFVHFALAQDAKTAADTLHNTDFLGGGVKVKVEMSVSSVRQRAGMGDRDKCFRCGREGHWTKDCPKAMNDRPMRGGRFDGPRRPYDPYMEQEYERVDPYMRRMPPPARHQPYGDPYLRRRPPPPDYYRDEEYDMYPPREQEMFAPRVHDMYPSPDDDLYSAADDDMYPQRELAFPRRPPRARGGMRPYVDRQGPYRPPRPMPY